MMGCEENGGMGGMMSKMTPCCEKPTSPKMNEMTTEMMLQCVEMALPNMPKEKRIDFVLKMVTVLIEQGCVGMSKKEKLGFIARVVENVRSSDIR